MSEEKKAIEWSEVKRKIALKQKLEKAKATGKKAWNWCLENPMAAIAILGAGTSIVTKTTRAYNTHAESVGERRSGCPFQSG